MATLLGLPNRGLFLSANAFHRRFAVFDDRAGRDLRPGTRLDDLPHAGRGCSAREQHALRACRQRLDREHQPRPRRRTEAEVRRRLGEFDKSLRRGRWIWRLPREWIWPRRREGGDVRVPDDRATQCTGSELGPSPPGDGTRFGVSPSDWTSADRPHAEALYRRQTNASRFRI